MIRQLFHPPDHAQAVLAAIRWRLDTDQFADLDPRDVLALPTYAVATRALVDGFHRVASFVWFFV